MGDPKTDAFKCAKEGLGARFAASRAHFRTVTGFTGPDWNSFDDTATCGKLLNALDAYAYAAANYVKNTPECDPTYTAPTTRKPTRKPITPPPVVRNNNGLGSITHGMMGRRILETSAGKKAAAGATATKVHARRSLQPSALNFFAMNPVLAKKLKGNPNYFKEMQRQSLNAAVCLKARAEAFDKTVCGQKLEGGSAYFHCNGHSLGPTKRKRMAGMQATPGDTLTYTGERESIVHVLHIITRGGPSVACCSTSNSTPQQWSH